MQGSKPLSAPQKALRKLGLVRDIDLALHLPLRYEDETRLARLREAREGDTVQIEGTVTANEIAYRPRRQLVVTLDDGTDWFQASNIEITDLNVGNKATNVIPAKAEARLSILGRSSRSSKTGNF